MQLFSSYVSWQNYVDTLLVDAEAEEIRADSALKLAEALAISASGETQVAKAKASANASEGVQRASNRWVAAKAQRKALVVQKDALDRLSNFTSRELSRRIGRDHLQSRQQRFGGA